MANIIAVIWDFDKTLIDGYMQEPIFDYYKVDAGAFWKEVNSLPARYANEQNVRVNADTIYLNHFINCAKPGGILAGLNNAKLREFGRKLRFYPGVPEIFSKTKQLIPSGSKYDEYGIKVEHYIVSTGMTEIIRGSSVMSEVEAVWGCELIEHEIDGEKYLGEIGYTIDNTSKTRAIFEINKGIPQHPDIDVNAQMPMEKRRVQFENMIYVADGPSDVPAFSLINKNGGSTFAIYPRGDAKAFEQVERLRSCGRIKMYAEADYSEGTTAYMWISNRIMECAERMYKAENTHFLASASGVPHHLNNY